MWSPSWVGWPQGQVGESLIYMVESGSEGALVSPELGVGGQGLPMPGGVGAERRDFPFWGAGGLGLGCEACWCSYVWVSAETA